MDHLFSKKNNFLGKLLINHEICWNKKLSFKPLDFGLPIFRQRLVAKIWI